MVQAVRALAALAGFLFLLLSGCSGDGAETLPQASPPTIVAQPADTQVTQGGAAQFSVSVAGSDVSFQWQRSNDAGSTWVNVAGATAATFSLPAVTLADNGAKFRAGISRSGVQTFSSAVTLTVAMQVLPVAITVQPVAQQATAGSNVSFAVTATGTALAYQWQSSSNGTDWTDIAGATQPTLQLTAVALTADGVQVRVMVRNALGSVTTPPVVLTVLPMPVAPAFGTQPTAVSVTAPAAAVFSVAVTGTPAPSLQWQRSSSNNGATYGDIAGATQTSYTTPATTLADNGALLRVRATNASGTALSNAVALNVSTALTAPSIQQQPQNTSVSALQTATWTVVASGNPTPTYQWQLSTDGGVTFANINGAHASSFSLVTAAGDSGRRVRVVLSNSQGAVNSNAALLTVSSGVMVGREWATAQSLEENNSNLLVSGSVAAIDDAGRVTVVFRKSNGNRDVVYATRGTPNGAGRAPTWTTPLPIDLLGTVPVSNMAPGIDVSVTAAPGGDVVALWNHWASCTANSYGGQSPFLCRYYYVARYRVAADSWDQPVLLTDTPDGSFTTLFNDLGDLVFVGNSWVPYANLRSTAVKAIFMKTSSETSFRRQLLSSEPTTAFERVQLDMDAAGNLLMATQYRLNGVSEIVAYRGTAATGLGDPLQLDTQAASALLLLTRVGLKGQQVVTWYHPELSTNIYAATSADASASFAVANIGDAPSTSLSVSDSGTAMLCAEGCVSRKTWTRALGWGVRESTGVRWFSFVNVSATAVTRNGDLLWVDGGLSATYDAALGIAPISTEVPYRRTVLGVDGATTSYGKPILSVSGIGFVSLQNKYDVLPSAAAPAGVVRTTGTSSDNTGLWGVFLK